MNQKNFNENAPARTGKERLSGRMSLVGASPTAAVSDRVRAAAAQGVAITNLGEGELDFGTPAHVAAAGKGAIDRGETKYTAVSGTAALKDAIRKKFERDNGLSFADSEIIAGNGAKQLIFNAFLATLDAGDEVIVPAPYWVSYPDMIRLTGGRPMAVATAMEDGWKLRPEALRQAVTPRTRWLVLNSPGNPTGAVYSAAELRALLDVLTDFPSIMILADDIYEPLRYGVPFATPLQLRPDLRDRVLTVNGVSKSHAMTGWRLGYAAGPEWLVRAMDILQSQSTSNPSSISQSAAIAALVESPVFLEGWLETLTQRRAIVMDMVAQVPGLRAWQPEGAFYVFIDVRGWLAARGAGLGIADDIGMAGWLIESARAALVPGSAFGAPGHLRLAFAIATDTLRATCDRIARACAGG